MVQFCDITIQLNNSFFFFRLRCELVDPKKILFQCIRASTPAPFLCLPERHRRVKSHSAQRSSNFSLNFLRVRRILCPAPQSRVLIVSPTHPANNCARVYHPPSYARSPAQQRCVSSVLASSAVIPRLSPEINTYAALTSCPR
jgi:hypothetical protein